MVGIYTIDSDYAPYMIAVDLDTNKVLWVTDLKDVRVNEPSWMIRTSWYIGNPNASIIAMAQDYYTGITGSALALSGFSTLTGKLVYNNTYTKLTLPGYPVQALPGCGIVVADDGDHIACLDINSLRLTHKMKIPMHLKGYWSLYSSGPFYQPDIVTFSNGLTLNLSASSVVGTFGKQLLRENSVTNCNGNWAYHGSRVYGLCNGCENSTRNETQFCAWSVGKSNASVAWNITIPPNNFGWCANFRALFCAQATECAVNSGGADMHVLYDVAYGENNTKELVQYLGIESQTGRLVWAKTWKVPAVKYFTWAPTLDADGRLFVFGPTKELYVWQRGVLKRQTTAVGSSRKFANLMPLPGGKALAGGYWDGVYGVKVCS
eukprot:TRINITY_DN61220_c0_g3_i1.p1 TRINITY_DN61220_c0_g3~~TRINITY_DN61220_c0_g3_i1.p1  ORF type:complete len:390 (+),score=19.81 TRINITY_DN61220_c0_g3_i1:41-1171(+)